MNIAMIIIAFVTAVSVTSAQNEASASPVVVGTSLYEYDLSTNHIGFRTSTSSYGENSSSRAQQEITITTRREDDNVIVEVPTEIGTRAHIVIYNSNGKRVYSDVITPSVHAEAVLTLDVEEYCLNRGTYTVVAETSRGRSSALLTITH